MTTPKSQRLPDVIVVGAGIIGSATAYYLARSGADLMLLDRRGLIAGGTASPACAGGVRQQGRMSVEIPLSIEAIDIWSQLETQLDADLGYRQDGMTVVADSPDAVSRLESRVAAERKLGLAVRMVYDRELYALLPGLGAGFLAGSYCPSDGHADPMRTVAAYVAAAERFGASIRWHCPAISLIVGKNRINGVQTPQGPIACGQVVLCAGFWSREIATSIGLDLPFVSRPLQMMVTARQSHVLDQVLGWMGHGISLKQVPSGGFVIGGGWPGLGDPATYATELMPGSMAKSAKTAVDLFPLLKPVPVVRGWVGIEAFCKDELQIVGPVPKTEGLFVAAGFSGHGFGIAPAVAKRLAETVATGRQSKMLDPFQLSRFNGVP